MATLRKRRKGWQVDYRIDGARFRIQINDRKKAQGIVEKMNLYLNGVKDKINLKRILDTV